MTVSVTATIPGFEAFQSALSKAPEQLYASTRKAYQRIGRSDIAKIKREQLQGGAGLAVKRTQLRNAFKAKTSGKDIDSLSMVESVGWKAARIFQEGGEIAPHHGALFVPFPGAIAEGGKLKRGELEELIASGKLAIAKTSRGLFVVQKIGKTTRFLGKLVRSVTEKKRISFFENYTANEARHEAILSEETGKALDAIAGGAR